MCDPGKKQCGRAVRVDLHASQRHLQPVFPLASAKLERNSTMPQDIGVVAPHRNGSARQLETTLLILDHRRPARMDTLLICPGGHGERRCVLWLKLYGLLQQNDRLPISRLADRFEHCDPPCTRSYA